MSSPKISLKPALAFNHVGITVPDIFAAIDWYAEVFGAAHIMGPRLLKADAQAEACHINLTSFSFGAFNRTVVSLCGNEEPECSTSTKPRRQKRRERCIELVRLFGVRDVADVGNFDQLAVWKVLERFAAEHWPIAERLDRFG